MTRLGCCHPKKKMLLLGISGLCLGVYGEWGSRETAGKNKNKYADCHSTQHSTSHVHVQTHTHKHTHIHIENESDKAEGGE